MQDGLARVAYRLSMSQEARMMLFSVQRQISDGLLLKAFNTPMPRSLWLASLTAAVILEERLFKVCLHTKLYYFESLNLVTLAYIRLMRR